MVLKRGVRVTVSFEFNGRRIITPSIKKTRRTKFIQKGLTRGDNEINSTPVMFFVSVEHSDGII